MQFRRVFRSKNKSLKTSQLIPLILVLCYLLSALYGALGIGFAVIVRNCRYSYCIRQRD